MSDDPSTPALRLKPRVRTDGSPPAGEKLPPETGSEAESSAAAVAVLSPENTPLKLRPRSNAATDPVSPPLAPLTSPPAGNVSVAVPIAATVAVQPPAPAVAPSPSPAASAQTPVAPAAKVAPPSAPSVVSPVISPAPTPAVVAPELTAKIASPPTPPAAPAVSSAAAAPAAPGEAVDASRFRLKPRVAGSEGAPASPPPGVISTKPLIAALPPSAGVPAPAIGDLSSSPAAAPGSLPKITTTVAPAIKVVSPALAATVSSPGLPSSARLSSPSSPGEAAQLPENTRAFKAGIWVVTTLVVVVAAGGALFAYRFLHPKEEASAPLTVRKPPVAPHKADTPAASVAETPAPAVAPTHEPVVAAPQSLPGKMVGKARDVIAARDQSGQVSGVGEILGDTPEVPHPAPVAPPVRNTTSTTNARNLPLDGSAPPEDAVVDKPAAPPPSIAFRTFVANLRVSGVFQGEPGRALLNGKTIRVGDIADNTLGIRLLRLDPDRKILYFEDNTGSTMQRRY